MAHVPCPIELEHVWKQYQLGSKHDSLRDAIPALLKRFSGRNGRELGTGEFWALQDVSVQVPPGQTLGVIGPNGAGKSTLLKLLSRICKQTKGVIRVRGRLAALIEVGAGFHPDLTGRENIYLNGTIMGLSRKEIHRLFDAIVAFSELEKFLEMPVKRYSSGMAVRLGFAVVAHLRPDILLIDEVLAVGDLAFQQKCYQRILELKARGTTILFVSHNLEAVARLCDRAILLQEGCVACDASVQEAMTQYRQRTLEHSRFQRVWTPLGEEMAETPKDIHVASAQLVDADGHTRTTFETGQALQLRLRFRAGRPIAHPSVTVTIERIDGLICHETSTQASGFSWETWEDAGCLTLDYSELNLLPNAYQVHVGLYEGQNPVPVARLSEPLVFHVTSDLHARGAVHLPHAWNVTGS